MQGRGLVLNVQAKTVNKETVIEAKIRMKFTPKLFQSLGKTVQQPCDITFDPAQEEIPGTAED